MSSEDKNTNGQLFMEDSHRRVNKYACASVLAACIVSAMFGYGEYIKCTLSQTLMSQCFFFFFFYRTNIVAIFHEPNELYELKKLSIIL